MKWIFLILLIACSKKPEIATDLPIRNYQKTEAPCDDATKVKLDLEKKAQEVNPKIQLSGGDTGCTLDKN
jgi:hypothetical protein